MCFKLWGSGEAEDKETRYIYSVLHSETELFVVKIILLITSSEFIFLHPFFTITTNTMSAPSSSNATGTQEGSDNVLLEQHGIGIDCVGRFATLIREDWEANVSCPSSGKHDENGNIVRGPRDEWLEKWRGDHGAQILGAIFLDVVTKYSPAAGKTLNRKFSLKLEKEFGANWVSSPTYLAVVAVYLQPETSPEQHITHSARIVLPAKWSSHVNPVKNQTQETWFSYQPFLENSNGSLYSSTVMLPESLNTTKDRPQLNLSLKGLGDSLSTIPDYYSELTRCW
jgi:hypothetical protein